MSGAVTAAFTAASAAAVNVGMDFQASMSQVAATMGITADTQAFETLEAAAKEMGESTQFSAAQASSALNFLALAGYDAEKSIAALPTVLNVAAAGGMELASASDMITDAMSALGLSTDEMTVFADRLAVTAQKSNTSVAQLGEAILTVGGTAKILSGGVVEMNTALGILADNGIKSAEGGTALRNVILSLSAPTNTAAAALAELNVTAFDAAGNMRPLQDTFADLNAALSKMSDQERTSVLNEIFNKVDLKSVNALLGTSAERFEELSGYIEDCEGAAADMAKTMNDNLKGDLTILGSALEGAGIAAFEKFEQPLRSAVQGVTESVGDLTANLTDGELSASMDKVATGMSNIAESTLKLAAEDVLPAAIEGFAWIVDNGKTLTPIITTTGSAVAAYAISAKGAAAAQKLLNAELALNPYALPVAGAVALTAALVNLAGASKRAAQELKNSARDSLAEYESQKTIVEGINTELEEINATIDEIQSKGALTFTDEQELENLKAQSAELSAQLEIEKELLKLKEKKSADDAYKAIMSKDGGISVVNRKLEAYKNTLSEYTGGIEYWQEKLNKALREGDTKAAEEAQKSLDIYTERMNASKNAIFEDLQSLNEFVDDLDLTTEKGKEAKEAVEQLNKEVFDYYGITPKNKERSLNNIYNASDSAINQMGTRYAEEYTAAYEKARQASEDGAIVLADQQAENLRLLQEGWENLEHEYATSATMTEAELYDKKKALWNKYGDESLKDHWKYIEDISKYDKDFAEEQIKLAQKEADERENAAEEAAKEEIAARQSEWENIERLNNLGIISDKKAVKARADFVKTYYGDADFTIGKGVTDENYQYLKKVYDDNADLAKQSLDKQKEIVSDGLSDVLKVYQNAYDELEQKRKSYRDKLMSVGGDLFSVDVTEKNGKKTTTYTVNNLNEQLRAMREYHSAVKNLRGRGASDALISELTSLGDEDSRQFAKYLSGMSASEFAKVNKLYNEKQKIADELSQDLYKNDAQMISDSYTNALADLATSSYEYGAQSAFEFAKGFEESMQKLGLSDLSVQLEAAGATKRYENYRTSEESKIGLEVEVAPAKTVIAIGEKVIGEAATVFNIAQKRKQGT
ncbi:MAG: phage tail tape measure protein [Oscillospiraceae bacterium]|nr:phage tail tape measure protein [Oscillospiraceae bacterium]